MITDKMNKEANEFSNLLKDSIIKKPEPTMTLHPELTIEQMTREMKFTHSLDPRHPRNFFDHTKNNETANAFISGNYDNTATYRNKYQDMQDPSGKWQVQTANDLALRNMLNTHKAEMAAPYDIEQKDTIAIQHKFEVSYFKAREARFDFEKRPDIALAPKEVEKLEAKAHDDFRAYKADKYGLLPNEKVITEQVKVEQVKVEQVKVEKKEQTNSNDQITSELKKPALPSFQEKMLAMRLKHSITQKPTLSRSM